MELRPLGNIPAQQPSDSLDVHLNTSQSGKDNGILSGWRQISLININTDTKIIGKILVSRIKGVLPKLIDVDQHAFIPGRYIEEATRLISDILDTKIEKY